MMKIKAVIKYKIKENHPDIEYVKGWNRDKVYEFEDTYYIDPDRFWGDDHINSFIKHDLALVAGGGYGTDGIEVVKYDLQRV